MLFSKLDNAYKTSNPYSYFITETNLVYIIALDGKLYLHYIILYYIILYYIILYYIIFIIFIISKRAMSKHRVLELALL